MAAEGGAGGKEVGRISIRVVPNLDHFRSELQSRLDDIEKSVKCKVRIEPDMDHFREDVDAATRNLKDAKVKVKTEIDKNGDLVHDLDRAAEDAGRSAKPIEPKIKPKIDEKNFQAQLRAVNAQAKLANTKLNIDFDDKAATAKLEAEILKLKAIAKAQSINLRMGEDEKPGLISRMLGAGGGAAAGFKMPDFLPNIAGLGGIPSIMLIVGALSLLAPALALVSSALVGLPALVTAVAAPIGVLALGFGGIKKALEDSGILTDTKGKNGKDKIGLGTFLKQIQESVSNVFEKGLTPLFKQMFDAFSGNIPILQRGLPFIAQGIVDFATGITRALSSVPNLQMMDRLTNSIGTMMTNLTPGITSFSNGMLRLITDVGDHLPGLGNVMSGWADRFSNWVSKIDKPKKDWFGGDIPGSSTLDSAVTNMKPVMESVINFVGKLTDAGLKLAANPQMADNIKKVVDGITNIVTNVLPQLNTVFDKIAAIMGKISPDGKPPIPPGLPTKPSPRGATFAGLPPGVAPVEPVKPADIPKTGFGLIEQWLKNTFTRPHTDHPVIVQGDAGGQQPIQQPQKPQQVQSPKVDMNGIAQSIQGGAGVIAAAANAAFKALVDAATVAVSQCVAAVQQLPGAIAQALSGIGPAGAAAGQALGTGMAGGIAASAPAAIAAATALAQGVENAAKVHLGIKSPSRVFHEIGQNTAEGFQNGLEGGFQGVLDSAKNLTQQVTDAVANHTAGPQLKNQIKQQLDAIDIEKEQLRAQSAGTSDKGQKQAIKGQIDQLNIAKDQLKVQGTQLGYSDKFGSQAKDTTKEQQDQLTLQQDQLRAQLSGTKDKEQRRKLQQQIDELEVQKKQLKLTKDQNGESDKADDKLQKQLGGAVNKMVGIGKNFAMSNVNQFESDVGISGQGAIPTLANLGLDWGTQMLGNMVNGALGLPGSKTEIHVNSVDEALEAKRTTENRRALTHSAGR